MGSLAKRYGDAARSGVYRVSSADVPRAAAGEAGARLIESSAAALAGEDWSGVREALARAERSVVLLVDGACSLVRHRKPEYLAIVDALNATALRARQAGRPFFAVLIDKEGVLPLAPLYKEATRAGCRSKRRSSGAA